MKSAIFFIVILFWLPRFCFSQTENKTKNVYVIATMTAKQGRADSLEIELFKNATIARKEAGCIFFEVHRGIDEKNVFVLYEKWKDRAALDKHFETPHTKDWFARRDYYLEKRDRIVAERLEK